MRELIAIIRKNGFKVVKTGGGSHQKILAPNGAVVRDDNGPLILSGSPSEHRWRDMHVNRLMKAGVLKSDPWDPRKTNEGENGDGGGKSPQDEKKEREKEERRAAAQERSDRLRVRTQKLQSRLEPIVAKLGGWSRGNTGVSIADFQVIVRHWQETREVAWPVDSQNRPLPTTQFRNQCTALRTPGSTVGIKWFPIFEGFVSYLESEAGNPPDPKESALMYMELLRETKGVAPIPRTEPQEPEPAPGIVSTFEIPGGSIMTGLSLEVLYRMARGAGDGDAERDQILRLAQRVAELDRKETT